MTHTLTHSVMIFAGLLVSGVTHAAVAQPSIPEPSVLGLLAIGGVVGAIVAVRKRRK